MILNQLLKHMIWWVNSGSPMPHQLYSLQVLPNPRWALASFWPCKKILLKEFSIPSSNVRLSPKTQEELACPYTTSDQPIAISEEQTDTPAGSFLCSGYSTTPPGTVTKVVVKERVLLRYILNHGIRILKNSLSLGKTMARKSNGPEIFSMLCGFPTCLWRESRTMVNGLSCVPMSVPASLIVGVTSSRNSMKDMKKPVEAEKL